MKHETKQLRRRRLRLQPTKQPVEGRPRRRVREDGDAKILGRRRRLREHDALHVVIQCAHLISGQRLEQRPHNVYVAFTRSEVQRQMEELSAATQGEHAAGAAPLFILAAGEAETSRLLLVEPKPALADTGSSVGVHAGRAQPSGEVTVGKWRDLAVRFDLLSS